MTAPSSAPTAAGEQLRGIGGEFRDAALEAAFEDSRAAETFRHSRTLLTTAVVLNTLFLLSDWRFVGTPHFWIAVPARLVVIAVALGCAALVPRLTGRGAVQRLMTAWMLLTAVPVAILCSSRSEIALLIVVVLPAIYYLCAPVRFRPLLGCGVFASLAVLIGYHPPRAAAFGLIMVMVMLNVALVLAVTRSNRLQRIAWLAVQTEHRLRAALDRSGQVLERMFAACPVPLLLTDRADGTLMRMSDSCADLLGTAAAAALRGRGASPGPAQDLARALADGAGAAEFETAIRLPGGEERTLLVKSTMLEVDGRAVVLAGLLDITQRKAAQVSLERLASTDALTGLRNRLSFFSAARAEMLRAARARAALSLLMVDIDHFKQINDTHGHQGGDAALRAFAGLCDALFGRGAVIGRLGGEEFGVLLPNTDTATAMRAAEDLRAAAAALAIDHAAGSAIRLTVSIGVAGIRGDDRDIDGALGRADLALYGAKRAGRNRVTLDESAVAGRRLA